MELITLYRIIIVFTCLQRIAELFLSKRNEKFILSLGGKIIPERNYLFMVLLHTSWLVSLLYICFYEELELNSFYFYFYFIVFSSGQLLRISAISTLGKRWSTRIVVLPNAPIIKKNLFNFIKHPNYCGVVIEIFSLPLMAGLNGFALFFSLFNFIILYFRIKKEEQALRDHNNYTEVFGE